MAAGRVVKEEGGSNPLLDLIAADPLFGLNRGELDGKMDPSLYVGRAPQQVTEYLDGSVGPFLARFEDSLGLTGKIEV